MEAYDLRTADEVAATAGALVLEFGAHWCGVCRAAQPAIVSARSGHPAVRYVKVEDGPGEPLGRSFRVKLWPTLVFLRDGKEVARVVRPRSVDEVLQGFRQISDAGP